MHFGGIDGGHESDAHRVTNCLHSHTHSHKSGASGNINSRMTQMQMQQQQQDAFASLSDWFQRALRGGKSLLKGIWGTNGIDAAGTAGDKEGRGQIMAQMGDGGQAGNAHGTVNTLRAEQDAAVYSNPYFSAMTEKKSQPYDALSKASDEGGRRGGKARGETSRENFSISGKKFLPCQAAAAFQRKPAEAQQVQKGRAGN